MQVTEETARGDDLLDLRIANKEEMVRDVKAGMALACSDNDIVEFWIPRGGSMAKSRTTTLDFRKADFNLFQLLLGRIPCDTVLERRKVQGSLLISGIISYKLKNSTCPDAEHQSWQEACMDG